MLNVQFFTALMPPSKTSATLANTMCPIDALPYDVLREIFIHCLPPYPLRPYQMNAEDFRRHHLVPMLLCHVCAFWRMVALSTPILWSHLSLCITIYEFTSNFDWYIRSKKKIKLIRWWKRNQGSVIPPFITLTAAVCLIDNRYRPKHRKPLAGDSEKFLLDYLMTAQYLDIDVFLWERIGDRFKNGGRVSFPNLRTVVEGVDAITEFGMTFLRVGHEASALTSASRLHADGVEFPYHAIYADRQRHDWTNLTHISMVDVSMPLRFWFSFLCAVANIQWGYFSVRFLDDTTDNDGPDQCTLAHLTTLSIFYHLEVQSVGDVAFPISFLFEDLYLPALHTLSLYSNMETWRTEDSIDELSNAILCAPNLTTLHLKSCFLSFCEETEPFWKYASSLTHLQLEPAVFPMLNMSEEEFFTIFFGTVLSREFGWLDLANTECSIRVVTLIISDDNVAKDYATARLLELSETIPRVEFRLTSNSPTDESRDKWKEWSTF
ncbi:hypothetical protein BDN70DRAFT_992752 [Pholiota conissans]|uniref:F-box domain-containing protein n=1 Tax=Pholiota conissans TaxID=109636 RepID=A0A9P6D284_9AGAR|nr:hypothetical protein BDN70DRAFT_992752 [Pholiota conissans]